MTINGVSIPDEVLVHPLPHGWKLYRFDAAGHKRGFEVLPHTSAADVEAAVRWLLKERAER